MSDDESFVFMRPKAQVGSSGTVWSSEDYELRATRPDLHEVPEASSQFTLPFRCFVTRVKDKVKHFVESTTEVDVMAVTSHTECPFRAYEGKRLAYTSDYLERALDMANVSKMTAQEIKDYSRIIGMVQSALTCINDLVTSSDTGIHLWNEYKILLRKLEEILNLIAELQLPIGKTRLLELTDAGPGVGCNNIVVQYRMAEKILIHGYDKVLLVHRARGDSGQNEAEHTNASIGEALVTGKTLDWEYYKRFEGMTKEEIEALSLQEYEQLEENR